MINKKWNVKKIYKNNKEFVENILLVSRKIDLFEEKFKKLNEKTSVESFKKLINNEVAIDKITHKISTYAVLCQTLYPSDEKLKNILIRAEAVLDKWLRKASEFEFEVLKLSAKKRKLLQNSKELQSLEPRLGQLTRPNLFCNKSKQRILDKIEPIKTDLPNIYSNVLSKNVSYAPIKVNDKQIKVQNKNLKKLEASKDKSIRRNFYISKIKGQEKAKFTQAQTLSNFFHINKLTSESRGFSNYFEDFFREEKFKTEHFKEIMEVIESNKGTVKNLIKERKKELKIRNHFQYDNEVSIYDKKIPYTKAISEIEDSFSYFGEKSLKIVKKLKEENKIYVTDNAEGAMSFKGFCYRVGKNDPYVFTFYQRDLESAMTLAHELGHAIHETNIAKNNNIWSSDVPLSICETASYTHELVFLFSFLSKAKTKDDRRKILFKIADYYSDVMYNKALNSDFEYTLMNHAINEMPFDPETLSNIYKEKNDKFYKDVLSFSKISDKEWIGNERIFWDFYEFQYIIAFSIANHISRKIMNGNELYKEGFEKMMKAGFNESFDDILKLLNLTKKDLPQLVQNCFNELDELIEEIKILR